MSDPATLRARAGALHLHGLLAHWSDVATADWVGALLDWEEQERGRRSLMMSPDSAGAPPATASNRDGTDAVQHGSHAFTADHAAAAWFAL